MKKNLLLNPKSQIFLLFILFNSFCNLNAQGVTTAQIGGVVKDSKGTPLIAATVQAIHVPSGTIYGAISNENGIYIIQGMRIGGPYKVTCSYVGYKDKFQEDVYTNLGNRTTVDFKLEETSVSLNEVVISTSKSDIFSSKRTGASSTFTNNIINALPTIDSRSINGITKYNPNGNLNSFGAQDSRLNNFTIDGSQFNNAFGLGTDSQAGGRTGSTAISLDAIEEIQVNVAPFDVRQTGFVGSALNAVTRSGTNDFHGTAYYIYRSNDQLGSRAAETTISATKFNEKIWGASLGGPIIKNKLFFFLDAEKVDKTSPATSFVAKGSANSGTQTRVEKTDLDTLSMFLKSKYNYETGPYENFNNATTSRKYLARLDYNIDLKNKLTLRYTHHDSQSDQPISNSNSLGAGSRSLILDAMAYQNSGYIILDNTRSAVAELNSAIGNKIFNNFIAGYDYQNEDRKYKGAWLPTVDILNGGKDYISFGFDPFTPNNQLNYSTFHVTDNVSYYSGKHNFTFGVNYENYKSNNLFFPGENGVYTFNSLSDFYAAANATSDTSPIKINRFQFRYSALPGGALPLQVLKINKIELYGQDEYSVNENFKVTGGLRAGIISFAQTSLENPTISAQTYIDPDGNKNYKVNTGQLPKAKVLWEPRLGFNYDVKGEHTTQLRGGTGIFTGRPPYVWISNQVGNNGILTGFIDVSNTTKYKFTPDASIFIPATPTLPSTFDIAATDPDYQFPQVWKNDLAIDYKLPLGFVGTIELMANKNINAVYYFDANMEPAKDTARFLGPDNRPRFGKSYINNDTAVRINDNVSRAAVMSTTNQGYYRSITFKLEYPGKKGFSGMIAYTRSEAKDIMSAGSIASGSYTSLRTVNGNNKPTLTFSDFDYPDHVVGYLGYRIEDTGNKGATQIFVGYSGAQSVALPTGLTAARYSYTYAGDMNGDGISNNDLIFIPNKGSDLSWEPIMSGGAVLFTPEQQADAFDKFVKQNDYLNKNKGKYSDRNGMLAPLIHTFDLSLVHEFYIPTKGFKNTLQIRADIFNVGNLINSEWGVGKVLVTDKPISFRSVKDGVPVYQLATQNINGKTVLIQNSYINRATTSDVWAMQFSLRYTF